MKIIFPYFLGTTLVASTTFPQEASIFFGRGSQIYKKLALIKLQPPHFSNKNFMTPHHRYTLPPKQAKIVLKSVFLNKINTLSVVIL